MEKRRFFGRLGRICSLLVVLTGSVAASAKVIYVDANAPGAGNGTSWDNAYNLLQDALLEARSSPGTNAIEIWVAQGIYTPDCNSAAPKGTGAREATFQLVNGVALRGGYAGFGGLDPNARDTTLYETILSGDLAHNDGPDFANYAENGYHVVTARYASVDTQLDGFTITAGNAVGSSAGDYDCGGGMYNSRDSAPTLTDCTFYRNNASRAGGGMYNPYASYPKWNGCRFRCNRARDGGGLFNEGFRWFYVDYPLLLDCTFEGNSADYRGGAVYNTGAAKPKFQSCVFRHNVAPQGGGLFNGGVLTNPACNLVDCTFEGNLADQGGAIYNEGYAVRASLTNCNFIRNAATFSGGGIHNNNGYVGVKGCDFVGNSTLIGGALIGGGAVYSLSQVKLDIGNSVFNGNTSAAVGGAIYGGSCVQGTTTCGGVGAGVINSTFVGNKAADCGGAVCWGIGYFVLQSSILWGNLAPEGKEIALDPHNIKAWVMYSDVEGGRAGLFYIVPDCRTRPSCPGDANCAPCSLSWDSNIDADPCFADPGYWDENGTPDDESDDFWVGGDYHLKSQTGRWDPTLMSWVQDDVTSPCIDKGHPNDTAKQYEPSPHAGIINMGAYGGTGEASKACFSKSRCGTLVEGDLNGDCLVDGRDLALMARYWRRQFQPTPSWCDAFLAGDVDYDLRIDFRDLRIIALHWCEEN